MRTINYLWRLVATGFCFLSFSLGGIILTLVIFPIFAAKNKDNSQAQRARLLVHKSFRIFIRMMAILGVIEYDVGTVEKELSNKRGKIIIANHPTLIDVVVLVALVPHAVCIVKEELWNNFFLKGVMKATDYIKNDGDVDALMLSCKESLDKGYSIVVFPEGTRTAIGEKMELQRGASNIALRCQADLVPIIVRCIPASLTKGKAWYNIPSEKMRFSLRIGNELKINTFLDEKRSMGSMARSLTEFIRDYYIRELRSYE